MRETSQIDKAGESFPTYLRRRADATEAAAPLHEGSTYYPPAWWRKAADELRSLAAEIEGIEEPRS